MSSMSPPPSTRLACGGLMLDIALGVGDGVLEDMGHDSALTQSLGNLHFMFMNPIDDRVAVAVAVAVAVSLRRPRETRSEEGRGKNDDQAPCAAHDVSIPFAGVYQG